VAELFSQALTEAERYRERTERANNRLATTIKGVGGLAAALAVITGVLFAGMGRREPNELQRQIDQYRSLEGKDLADRLHDYPPDLKDRLKELKKIRSDDRFNTVSDESQAYVNQRIAELERYIPYLEEVLAPRFNTLARDDEELDEREKALQEQLALHDLSWAVTGAGKLRQRALDDIALLRKRGTKAVERYRDLYVEGVKIREFRVPEPIGRTINWRAWQAEVESYAQLAKEPPDDFGDLPPNSLVTPHAILSLDKVRQARESILGSEEEPSSRTGLLQDLFDIRDIACALGLVPENSLCPALLTFPRKRGGDTLDLPLEVAWQRWRRLEPHPELTSSLLGLMIGPGHSLSAASAFPPTHPMVPPYFWFRSSFTLARVPPLARESVSIRARNNRDDLLQLLAEQWRGPMQEIGRLHQPETLEFWTELARRMKNNPDPRQPYRRFGYVLDRLSRLNAADPVAELIALIETPYYKLGKVRTILLSVPLDTSISIPDRSVLTIRTGRQEYRFPRNADETTRDDQKQRMIYTFTGEADLVLRPGEDCEAQLPLRNDENLTWYGKAKSPFAFLALSSWPRLHDVDKAPGRGITARNVELQIVADTPLPQAPELLKVLQSVQPAP
jgi:hypothetical protein